MRRFYFEMTIDDKGEISFKSEGDGVNIIEALGALEWKRNDLMEIAKGHIVPDKVKRSQIVEDDK